MRQSEGLPISGKESFINKAKKIPGQVGHLVGKKLRINNPLSSSQLVAESVGNLDNAVETKDPKLANTQQLRILRPAHVPAGVGGTAGTAATRTREAEKKPPTLGKIIVRSALGALALTEVAGAAIHEVRNDQPKNIGNITRNVPANLAWPYTMIESWLHKEIPVPPNFDPDAMKGTVKEGVNRITVSQDILENAYEKKVAQNKDSERPVVIFPIKNLLLQTFKYEYKEPVTSGVDSVTGEPISHSTAGAFRMNLDKGESIIVPAENVQIFKTTIVIDGQRQLVSLYMWWVQNGRKFAFAFAAGDRAKFIPQNGVMDAPDLPTTNDWRNDAKNGLMLPLGTELVTSGFNSGFSDNANFSSENPETGRWESVKPDYVMDSSSIKLVGP